MPGGVSCSSLARPLLLTRAAGVVPCRAGRVRLLLREPEGRAAWRTHACHHPTHLPPTLPTTTTPPSPTQSKLKVHRDAHAKAILAGAPTSGAGSAPASSGTAEAGMEVEEEEEAKGAPAASGGMDVEDEEDAALQAALAMSVEAGAGAGAGADAVGGGAGSVGAPQTELVLGFHYPDRPTHGLLIARAACWSGPSGGGDVTVTVTVQPRAWLHNPEGRAAIPLNGRIEVACAEGEALSADGAAGECGEGSCPWHEWAGVEAPSRCRLTMHGAVGYPGCSSFQLRGVDASDTRPLVHEAGSSVPPVVMSADAMAPELLYM